MTAWLTELGPVAQLGVLVVVLAALAAGAIAGAYGLVAWDRFLTARRRRAAGWIRWRS